MSTPDLGPWLKGLGIGSVITGGLAWLRFRKKDTADLGKTDAETQKLLADGELVKAQAQQTLSEMALKMAHELSKQCEAAKTELIRLTKELAETRAKMFEIHEAKEKLEKHCAGHEDKVKEQHIIIEKLTREVNELEIEIRRYKNMGDESSYE